MSQGFFDELSSKDVSGDISLLRTLVETLPDHVYVKDAEGRYVLNNLAHARALGISNPEEIAGKSDFDLYPKELAERYRADEQKIIRSGGRFSINKEQPGVDGEGNKKWHSTFKVPLRNNNGQIAGFLGVTRDVTEQKEAEEALRRSEAKFRSVVHNSTEIVKIVDVDGTLRYASPAFERVLGYSPEEAAGINMLDHVHPDDLPHVLEETEKALGEAGVGRNVVEYRFRHKDGSWRHMESVGTYLLDDPAVRGVVVNVRDVTERKEMEERLRHQAFHDSLTDLPNRILFLDRLEHALARAGREGGPVAVLFADLDDFKGVNDSLGHDAGNAVLVEVAERLRNHVRPGDTVGRIFGDEFAVLLEAPAGVEEARQVTERIQKSLQAPFNAGRYEVFMRASIGIAFGETIEDEPKEVLRHADLAMYEVKNSGKARYEVYDPSMDTRAMERMDLDKSLRRAMEHEEFEVHYQPKVRLATGATVGVEALVRWRHPDKGLLLPTQFIPHAEETGLMEQIGLWVLKESCRQIKEWQERYPEKLAPSFDLCANLSAKEIQQPDLAEKVAGVLHEAGLDPRCLMIEISERTAMEDAEQTIGKLRELKDLGVKLAIDDFGTGYCSLVYLEHSLLDVLKIDRMLIHRKREKWEECVQIVSAMTSMAQALGLEVVVEGVETEDQLAELKKMGCEMAQGFYFARPLPSEAVERLLVEGGYWR